MPLKTLNDLLIDELKDLLNAENQITKALPKMAKKASSQELKTAFEEHLRQTETQIDRLEKIFKEMDIPFRGKKCEGIEGIIQEGKDMMDEAEESEVLDAALIAAAQKVEHYEIASYGTVRTYAKELGLSKVADLLQETLDEESNANEKLTKIAQTHVNEAAIK
jgi:ferritin-like metal-binding protein YciE